LRNGRFCPRLGCSAFESRGAFLFMGSEGQNQSISNPSFINAFDK
jgi:hypothetical protein